jgi:hypothetical protein
LPRIRAVFVSTREEAIMRERVKPLFYYYWIDLTADEKRRLATRSGTAVSYLSAIAHGHCKAGASLIQRLQHVDERLTLSMMRNAA